MDYLCGREAQEQFYLLEGSVIPAIKAVAESKPFHESPPGKNHQAHLDSIAFGAPSPRTRSTPAWSTRSSPSGRTSRTPRCSPGSSHARRARMNDLLKEFK